MSDLPDSNPKTAIGLSKPSLASVPPMPLFEIGKAMSDGARKYGRFNWREHSITGSVYYDAMMRHLTAWYNGEDIASDSGVHHLAHLAACVLIVLDAEAHGKINDDRSKP